MNPNINQSFLAALDKLNPSQRSAVETIDGPVLVIAGPGTGKTQLLAARIGNILLETDARAENILCLTYTDAGSVAMRKRLLQFIGPEAYKVGIFTFHAFCNQVIQDNLDYFGIRDLQPVSELEQKQLIEKLIDNFDKDHPLKRWTGEVYYDSYRLQKLFQLMKTENWSYEYIVKQADSYIAELPTREDFIYKRKSGNNKPGDVKQDKIDVEIRKMNELKAAAAEFNNYETLMREKKRYDYDDMILWVLQAFEKESYILPRYQEQYQYFLVDEYQDTNGSQNAILKKLINNPVNEGKPNVLVVGDDDQSIYRFQGANVQNIMDFAYDYKDHLTLIMLTDNYRSSQNILNLSKHLIEKNQERLINKIEKLNKDLIANHPVFANSEIQPDIKSYPNLAQETAAIANEIERLKNENFSLEEVAVIYRNHRQSDARKKADILQSVFIQNILKLLQYIDAESKQPLSREDLLFEILHQSWFNIDSLLIAEMAVNIRKSNTYKNPLYWRKEIQKAGQQIKSDLFNNAEHDKHAGMKRLSDDIEFWIKERHNISLQLLIEKIITRGGILRNIMHSPEKIRLLEELHTFYDFVKSETMKNTSLTISGLIQTMDLYRKYDLSVSLENTSVTDKGVNFMTAHASKGLEFEKVFIIGCDKNSWDKAGRNYTFSLPDNMLPAHKEGDETEESRRLFYVAMTRAKSHLHISYAESNNDGKELEKSRFIAELIDSKLIQEQAVQLANDAMSEYNFMAMQEEQLPEVKLVEETFLRNILEDFKLSVTALNTYLKCPLSFYYNNMLRIPQAKNEAMTFGSAVHAALNNFFRKMQESNNEKFPEHEIFIADFENELKRHRDAFDNDESFKRRMEYGKQILPKYLEYYLDTWNKIVKTEIKVNALLNNIPLTGILDKLEFTGNDVNVVDYKTGQFSNAKKKFNPPVTVHADNDAQLSYEEEFGGDYWRQAVFYKILLDNETKKDWNVISTEFDFVEPDKKSQNFYKEKVVITPHDVKTVKEQITVSYNKIMNLEFSKGCNDKYCKWCNFVKSTYAELTVSEEAE
jgi:DNA helicase II / ATP-dependent DNA helicase PcrA